MGQTEGWLNICPITMNLDESKWDRIPRMSRTFLGGVRGGREALSGKGPSGEGQCFVVSRHLSLKVDRGQPPNPIYF